MKSIRLPGVLFSFIQLFMLAGAANATNRPPIIGLSHVCFQVADLNKSAAYFRELLGFDEGFRRSKDPAGCEMASFKINDRQYVELHAGLQPEQGDACVRLAYETTDAEAMRRYLAGKGVAVPDKAVTNRTGSLYFLTRDFEGNQVEFIQYLPGSLLMKARGKALSRRRLSERMFHAGMPVVELEAATRFYQDILGFREMLRSHTDRPPKWINCQVPEAGVYIEWMLMDKAADRQKLSQRFHIGLAVPDVQATMETLRERAAKLGETVKGFPRVAFNNRWQVGVLDPDGRRHELMEPYTMR